MSSTQELIHFPMKSQRTEDPTQVNEEYDCVATSLAACIQFLTGTATTGSELKNIVYGASYVGATVISDYSAEVARRGVLLRTISGTPHELLQTIRAELALGHPVVASEIDPYVDASLDWSHMIAFYACSATNLTAMDPYIAQPVTKDDAAWANVLKYNEVWPLSRQVTLPVQHVPQGWKDDGTTLTAPNGIKVRSDFRSYVLTHDWPSANLPLEAQKMVAQLEISDPALGGGDCQHFRLTTLEATTKKGVFEAWTGQELLALRQLCAQLTEERDALKRQPTSQK
jgi:hypothetical protein